MRCTQCLVRCVLSVLVRCTQSESDPDVLDENEHRHKFGAFNIKFESLTIKVEGIQKTAVCILTSRS